MVANPTSRQEEARPLPTERLKMVTRELVCIDKTPEAGPVSLDNLKKQTPLPKMAEDPLDNDRVGCRLQTFAQEWQGASQWLKTVIQRGFHWTWSGKPPQLHHPRHQVQTNHVHELVLKLEEQGAIYPVVDQPCFMSRIFAVPKSSGGFRLIVDLSPLNKFISCKKFHMSNHNTLRSCLDVPSWMTSVDVQDAYLHVPVRKSLHKFLAITSGNQLYFFRSLPFGLAPAPLVFTAIMKFPISKLRAQGVNVLNYLDDLIVWGKSPENAVAATSRVWKELVRLGFILNRKKSCLTPTQDLTWLGVRWNSKEGTCRLPDESIMKIAHLSKTLQNKGSCSRRVWESLMGRIAFAAQLSNAGKLFSHPIMRPQLFPFQNRDKVSKIPHQLKLALSPWIDSKFLFAQSRVRIPPPRITIWSDASLHAWGAISSLDNVLWGKWDSYWTNRHINVLELRTVLMVFQNWDVTKTSIQVATDNSTTVAAINRKGSTSPQIHEMAMELFTLAERRQIQLSAVHIQGRLNVVADSLSRVFPVATEWSLPQPEFNRLESLHGCPLEIDLFASPLNHKLPMFGSTLNHPRVSIVNAFTVDWNSWDQIYLFPPINLLPKVVQRLRHFQGHGLLIVPRIPSAEWFPFILEKCQLFPIVSLPLQKVQGQEISVSSVLSVEWIGCSF